MEIGPGTQEGRERPGNGQWLPRLGQSFTQRPRPLHPLVNLACFLGTVFSTLVVGTLMALDDWTWPTVLDVIMGPSYWSLGFPYSASLILILGAHEMGHYVACRIYRIDSSLPFFLPAPHYFGTFGAVIRIRASITNPRALFDIGVAGPIAGFVVAIPVLLHGLSHSTVVHQPPKTGDVGLTPCLLLEMLYPLFFPGMRSPDATVRLDPVFVAAWLGLLATALNLLPIGQLDGGHMLYAISKRAHHLVSRLGIPVLIVGGAVLGGWHLVTFGVIFAILGPRHPPLLEEGQGLGPGRMVVAGISLAIFVLCFIVRTPRVF
jgi:membrane-associated protease RseP (regulator of RpoE activity)